MLHEHVHDGSEVRHAKLVRVADLAKELGQDLGQGVRSEE